MTRCNAIFLALALTLLGASLVLGASYALVSGYAASGPGCPGDPEYLGWCSDVDGS